MWRKFFVLVALCFSLSSWAQSAPSLSTDSPPIASGDLLPLPTPELPMPSDPSATLSSASTELESTADRLDRLFEALRTSLQAAGISLDNSDASLESSVISATNGINSLAALREDLDKAQAEARRLSSTAALWRVGALSGVIGLAGCLAGKGSPWGAGIGAGIGALAGAVWWVVESWPPWVPSP